MNESFVRTAMLLGVEAEALFSRKVGSHMRTGRSRRALRRGPGPLRDRKAPPY